MEDLTLARLMPAILEELDPKTFATSGKSTDQAIAFILYLTLEALDRGNCSVKLFFADVRKAFDLIDNNILLNKLSGFNLHGRLLIRQVPVHSYRGPRASQLGSI